MKFNLSLATAALLLPCLAGSLFVKPDAALAQDPNLRPQMDYSNPNMGTPYGNPNDYGNTTPFVNTNPAQEGLHGFDNVQPGSIMPMQPGANPNGPYQDGVPAKMKKHRHHSVVGDTLRAPGEATKASVGATDKAAKTSVGLTDKAVKTTVGLPFKGVKEVFKALF